MSVTSVESVKILFQFLEEFAHGYDITVSGFDSGQFSIPRADGSRELQSSWLQTGVRRWGPREEDHSPVAKVILIYWERIPIGDFSSQQKIPTGPQGNMSKICERVASQDYWENFKSAGVPWVNTIEDVEVSVDHIGNLVKLTIQFALWIK